MNRVHLAYLPLLATIRHPVAARRGQVFFWGFAALSLLATGCAQLVPSLGLSGTALYIARASGADAAENSTRKVRTPPAAATAPAVMVLPMTPNVLAIDLDTVFRLAEDQNVQVALARARVREASAESNIAALSWLPRVDIGTVYYRHEGGIANENGTITRSSFGTLFGGLELASRLDIRDAVYQRVSAERQLWQQKGELQRITTETLLDAANTYVDLLAARTAEAVAGSMQQYLQDLLRRAQKRASAEPGARVEVDRIQAQLKGRDQIELEMREQAVRGSVKLAYLLGVDPSLTLLPVDAELIPLELVDVAPPVTDLVARALATGPGVQEMEGLLALIHESIERSKGPGRLLPVFEVYMSEGIFGTGPGSRSDWDNSWNLGVAARWNLTGCLTRCDRERVLQAKTEQAHLAYQDLRAKLTAGVYEAREAILSGRKQIRVIQDQITDAKRAYQLSEERLRNNVAGSSASEILLSLQTLSLAQSNYVNILRAYDKAQLRLLMLLGARGEHSAVDGNCPILPGRGQ